jgi:DNA-binding response OmpR family regulator
VKRVLVVEDDADVGYVLDLLLGLAGYAGRRAEGVAAARGALALGAYDLALVDRFLPDGDGLARLRHVSRARYDLVARLVAEPDCLDAAHRDALHEEIRRLL